VNGTLKVLVTGGAGFIGSNFVVKTVKDYPDFSITVLDALTYAGDRGNLQSVSDKVHFVRGDVRDAETVDRLVKANDLVVHFAAESHNDNSLRDPGSFLTTNVNGTYNLLMACLAADTRYHHISTDEVFGDLELDANDKFTETTPYNPSSPYSASKAASDLLVRAWVRSFGLRATITNCSNNYGPNQHKEKLIPNSIFKVVQGLRPTLYGLGTNVRDWIHVDDHTTGVWAAVEKGNHGETYLLGANNERSNFEVLSQILKTLGKASDFIEYVEDRPGHDIRYAIDSNKALSELGWKPRYTNFEANIEQLVHHYKLKFENVA
jgi:dTDP-glucose 4,6-dehydratase